jgi:hypothetical protein
MTTRIPSREKRRAREALSPAPAPTINAISSRGVVIESRLPHASLAARKYASGLERIQILFCPDGECHWGKARGYVVGAGGS